MSFVKQREPMLRDDPALPSELRRAFAAYRDVSPSAAAHDALFANLEQALGVTPRARWPHAGMWLLGLMLLGVTAAGLSWRPLPDAAAVAPAPEAPEQTVRSEPRGTPAVVALAAEVRAPERSERRRPEPRAKPAELDPSLELALLTRAKRVLPSDAAAALALAREHEARFPRGMFAQEREVIAVEALARAGDGENAQRRAAAFQVSYPNSTHLERLRVVLAESR